MEIKTTKKAYQVVNEQIDLLKWLDTSYPVKLADTMLIYNGYQAKPMSITSRPELDGLLFISKDLNNLDCDMVYHKSIKDSTVYFIDLLAYLDNCT